MRTILSTVLCGLALTAVGVSASTTAFACKNKECPMEKAGKKCNHKTCKHCKGHKDAKAEEATEKKAE